MTDLSKEFSLPISPYLDNSTEWWAENNSYDEKFHLMTKSEIKMMYKEYQQWMKDQGVIIRDPNKPINLNPRLIFVDESSMIMFALKWGN